MQDAFQEYEDLFPSLDFLELSDELTERLTYVLLDAGYLTADYDNHRSMPIRISNHSRRKEDQNGKGVWEGIVEDAIAARQMSGEHVSPEEYEELLTRARIADIKDIAQRDAASVSQCSCYIELRFDEGAELGSKKVSEYCNNLHAVLSNAARELAKEYGIQSSVMARAVPDKRAYIYQAICYDSKRPRVDIYKC